MSHTNTLKISFVFLEPYRPGHGGYTHASNLIKALSAHLEINLFAPSYSEILPGFWGRLFKILKTQWDCIKHSKDSQVIYLRCHFLGIFLSAWAYFKKKRVVIEVNGPFEDVLVHWKKFSVFSPLIKLLFFLQFKLANQIIVVTPQLKEYIFHHTRIPKRNIHLIPNAADHQMYHPNAAFNPNIFNINFPKKYAIFFGSLVHWQGIDLLLQAFTEPAWPSDVHLIVAGNGPLRKLVMEYSEKFQNIHYLGLVTTELLPGLIANSLCSIIPKKNLGFRQQTGLSPIKLYESLSCGIPVIVTNITYISDIVQTNHLGIVINQESPSELADAVASLNRDEQNRSLMCQNARNFILNDNTWKHRGDQTYQIIIKKDLLKNSLFLARKLEQAGKLDSAAKIWALMVSLDIEHLNWHIHYARLLVKINQFSKAELVLKNAMSFQEKSPLLYSTLGYVLEKQERLDEAITYYELSVVSSKTNHPDLLKMLGLCAFRLGNFEKSQAALKKATEAGLKNAKIDAILKVIEQKLRSSTLKQQSEQSRLEMTPVYYDEVYTSSKEKNFEDFSIYIPLWEKIIHYLDKSNCKRVLDLGCGPGLFAKFLKQRLPYLSYTGIDFSPTAIELGRTNAKDCYFLEADVFRTSLLTKELYDVVICTELLEHVIEDQALIQNLKSNTLFLGSVPNFYAFGHLRYFKNAQAVYRRYFSYFKNLEVEPVSIGKKNVLFLIKGVLGNNIKFPRVETPSSLIY